MTRRFASLAPILGIGLVAGLLAFGAPRVASAANNDEEALALVDGVFASDFVEGKYADALEKLQLAATVCEGGGCSPEVTSKVYVGIGTVFAAGLQKPDDAKEAFRLALKEDPKAQLLKGFDSDEVKTAFAAAGGSGGGKPAAKKPASRGDAIPERACDEGGRAPRGWRSNGAYQCYQKALGAEEKREWLECAGWALGSTKTEERSTSRFLAASCLERGGRWVEALAQYEKVADAGTAASKQGREKADALLAKVPKLVVRPPSRAQDLVVRLDGNPLEANQLGGELWIDPGEHTVTASGKIGGEPVEFEQTVSVGEFESASVDVRLVPKEATISDSAIMKCMTAAKTREDFAKCIGEGPGGTELNLLVGTEVSGYTDSDNVSVVTPGAFGSVVNPTEGWSAGGAFLVDVVTAASSDIVATASPRWTEVRYVPSLNGSYKLEDVTLSGRANASFEPDYLALGGGITAAMDLREKTITPSLGYDFGYDVSGRTGTSFSAFSRKIHRHGIDAAVSLVLDKATVLTLGLTSVLEFGDSSKPYRYIPMFSPEIAEQIPAGLQADAVDFYREPERVLEQVPTDRQRYAASGRIAHRFASSTIRAEERLYVDSWGILASTTDARYVIDLDDRWRVWPHGRAHLQTGADFWKIAYAAVPGPNGVTVPALRAGDRELGPMIGLTGGGGARWALGEEKNWALTLSADAVYTRFLDHLYILERIALFSALSLEVEIE